MLVKDFLFWTMYFVSFYFSVFLIITLFERNIWKKPHARGRLPSVTVAIPAYNEEDTIAGTVDSVIALDYPKELLEVIVVNDGSADKTQSIVESRFVPKGVILINQKNGGKGAAMNNALGRSRGELFACLDADSFVQRDTLRKMVDYFGEDSVAAVTPVLKVRSPKSIIQKAQWLEYVLYNFLKMILATIECLNVAPGPFSIYRKKHILEVGGFDESSIVEDQEIACRLQKHNYRILQSHEGDVLTIAPRNLRELYVQRRRWYKGSVLNLYKYRNMLFNKKYGDFGMFQLPSLIIGILVPFIVLPLFLSYTIPPLAEFAKHAYLVGFDVLPKLTFDFNIQQYAIESFLGMDYAKLFIIALVFLISVRLMSLAHKNTSEKVSAASVIPLVFFFIIYYIVISFMWAGSMAELALGKRKTW